MPETLDRKRFLDLYYAQVPEDAFGRPPRELAAAALAHLEFALAREAGTAKVRAFNPTLERDGYTSKHTIVETANDDMPFLVDSLTMALNGLGHPVHLTIHPVLRVSRDASGRLVDVGRSDGALVESWIHFEIPRETYRPVLERIEERFNKTLESVRAAVEDWGPMLEHMRDAAEQLRETPGVDADVARECHEFLRWLAEDHFTLLGYREHDLERGRQTDKLVARPGTGLGILRESERELDSMTLRGRTRTEARSAFPLIVTKANAKSSIHRPALMDYIGVKVFDEKGRPAVERRFLGLFTSIAYNESPRDIPLLRLKVAEIMDRSGLDARSHRGKALQHILDTFPRDDLIQGSIDELSDMALGILALRERHKVSLFLRRETFERFYSCLVYVPREQYDSSARRRIESLLSARLDGEVVDAQPTLTESALARLVVLIRTEPGKEARVDGEQLRLEIEETVRTWNDRLRERLLATRAEEEALALFHDYSHTFSEAYKEAHPAERADRDLSILRALETEPAPLRMTLEPVPGAAPERMRFTAFVRDEPVPLYRAMPILQPASSRRTTTTSNPRRCPSGSRTSTSTCRRPRTSTPRRSRRASPSASPACCSGAPRTTTSTASSSRPGSTGARRPCCALTASTSFRRGFASARRTCARCWAAIRRCAARSSTRSSRTSIRIWPRVSAHGARARPRRRCARSSTAWRASTTTGS